MNIIYILAILGAYGGAIVAFIALIVKLIAKKKLTWWVFLVPAIVSAVSWIAIKIIHDNGC